MGECVTRADLAGVTPVSKQVSSTATFALDYSERNDGADAFLDVAAGYRNGLVWNNSWTSGGGGGGDTGSDALSEPRPALPAGQARSATWAGGVNLTVDQAALAAPLALVLNANERQPGIVAPSVHVVRVSFCGDWDQTVLAAGLGLFLGNQFVMWGDTVYLSRGDLGGWPRRTGMPSACSQACCEPCTHPSVGESDHRLH
jgi:hypothetical protein